MKKMPNVYNRERVLDSLERVRKEKRVLMFDYISGIRNDYISFNIFTLEVEELKLLQCLKKC